MSPPAEPRILVARGVDGLLVGWLATIVWIAVFAAGRLGVATPADLSDVYWVGAVVTAAHFGLSYHLAYRRGRSAVRARPVALAAAPLGLLLLLAVVVAVSLAAGAGATRPVTSALITSVYLMTTWHYVKQVYGVGRVGAAYAGVKLGPTEAHVLRYGLYPLWFLGAVHVLIRGSHYSLAGYSVGFGLLPAWTFSALHALVYASAVPLAVVLARITLRRGGRVPSLVAAPYVASFLWLGLPMNPVLTVLLLAPFHALQYLAIGHRAEIATAEGEISLMWWLNIFAGAACGGLLLSRWAPALLDSHLRAGDGPLLFSAAFFVFLNLHHYLIDATIWRSKGELVKALVRPPALSAKPTRASVLVS
jgi:hypothetical protein